MCASSGGYTIIFGLSLWVIWHKRTINIFLAICSILNYFLSTTGLALNLLRMVQSATIVHGDFGTTLRYGSNHKNSIENVHTVVVVANVSLNSQLVHGAHCKVFCSRSEHCIEDLLFHAFYTLCSIDTSR